VSSFQLKAEEEEEEEKASADYADETERKEPRMDVNGCE